MEDGPPKILVIPPVGKGDATEEGQVTRRVGELHSFWIYPTTLNTCVLSHLYFSTRSQCVLNLIKDPNQIIKLLNDQTIIVFLQVKQLVWRHCFVLFV